MLIELAIANSLASTLFDREVTRLGLRTAQVGMLTLVHLHGPITPTALERETGLPGTTARERLQGLIGAGYVERIPNEDDRRSYFLDTTPEGDAFLTATIPAAKAVEEAIERELGVSIESYRGPLEDLRRAAQAVRDREDAVEPAVRKGAQTGSGSSRRARSA